MALGRFVPMVLVLALAGRLVAQKRRPATARDHADAYARSSSPSWSASALVVTGLTYFPAPRSRTPRGGAVMNPRALDGGAPAGLAKLDPRHVVRTPVIFVVWVGSLLTTVLAVVDPAVVRRRWWRSGSG